HVGWMLRGVGVARKRERSSKSGKGAVGRDEAVRQSARAKRLLECRGNACHALAANVLYERPLLAFRYFPAVISPLPGPRVGLLPGAIAVRSAASYTRRSTIYRAR